MKPLLVVALATLVSIAACAVPTNIGFSVKVPVNKQECFLEDVPSAKTKVYVHFLVTDGNPMDIDLFIYGPDAQLIWGSELEKDARVLFTSRLPGLHKFCFSNQRGFLTTASTKTVTFTIHTLSPSKTGKSTFTDPVSDSIVRIAEGLGEIKDEQNYLRTRERVHRDTVESTNSRVMYMSIGEIALIVLVGVGQVVYLKRAFDSRRSI